MPVVEPAVELQLREQRRAVTGETFVIAEQRGNADQGHGERHRFRARKAESSTFFDDALEQGRRARPKREHACLTVSANDFDGAFCFSGFEQMAGVAKWVPLPLLQARQPGVQRFFRAGSIWDATRSARLRWPRR
jgi:hypothetical protein